MAEKGTQMSLSCKIAITFVTVALVLCCGEFVRLELMLKVQQTRMNHLEDMLSMRNKGDLCPTRKETQRFKRALHLSKRSSPLVTLKEVNQLHERLKIELEKMMDRKIAQIKSTLLASNPNLKSPTVLTSSQQLTADEKKSAIFQCSASGSPKPVVTWIKVNGTIPTSRSITDNSGKLEIQQVAPEDAGVYQCKAVNLLGEAKIAVTLEVNSSPRVVMKKALFNGKSGETVNLPECKVTGNPKPTITWTKVPGSLPAGRHVLTNGKLTLLRTTMFDSGTYICHAKNSLGSAQAGTVLIIHFTRTTQVLPPTSATGISGKTVELNCSAKSAPDQRVTWKREKGILPYGRYEMKGASLILKNLKESDSGVYVCTATSDDVFIYKAQVNLTVRPHRHCSEIYKSGEKNSGVYIIEPDDQGSFEVYCDMSTDGGGWTVLHRRQANFPVNFYRNWKEYKTGFGNLSGEFWLGNDYIHRLTKSAASSLRVNLEDWDERKLYATYDSFSIGDESDKYRLRVGVYQGSARDSLFYHHNVPFSTKDKDNDQWKEDSCAVYYEGAWWYRKCCQSNLNAKYVPKSDRFEGPTWFYPEKVYHPFKKTEMKIRAN